MQEKPKKRAGTRAASTTATSKTAKASATPRTAKPKTATKARATANNGTATAVLDAPRMPSHDEIAVRAHLLYEQSGFTHGRDAEFWLEAEKQLIEELNS